MINTFIEDAIDDRAIDIINELYNVETDNFIEQVKVAQLDKARHFRHANLQGVCFDNSDLRGFDFTGADLEGATGRNVWWDETTILTGANVVGSVFGYEIARKEFFAQQPKWHSLYLRKQKEHWASNANWFSDQLAKPGKDQAYLVEVAKAICDTTKDGILRSQLLLALAPTFKSGEQHRDFLIHNLAKHADNTVSIRTSIQAMAALYGSDEIVLDILQRELFNSDYTIREAAIKGLIDSKSFRHLIGVITPEIRKFSSSIRRLFVWRAASCFHSVYVKAVTDPTGQFAIDFNDFITDDKIERIARAQLVQEGQRRLAGRRNDKGEPAQPNISEKQVRERAVDYETYLRRLQAIGVPFVFKADKKITSEKI